MNALEVARDAARAGGAVLMGYFGQRMELIAKDPTASYNLVSRADLEAEQAIVRVIRDAFPRHAVLGEESHQGDIHAEHLWIVDPLDGTNNFVHAVPHFAVSVAYYCQGQAVHGIIFNPARGDWYEVSDDQGASYNQNPVSVAPNSQLEEVLVGVGFYYDRGAMMEATLSAIGDLFRRHIHGIRRFGTASLDLVAVGTGAYGAFFELELSPWDFAAGRLFVEAAGGRITTCRGQQLPIAKTSVLASNGLLHDSMLELLAPHVD